MIVFPVVPLPTKSYTITNAGGEFINPCTRSLFSMAVKLGLAFERNKPDAETAGEKYFVAKTKTRRRGDQHRMIMRN
jgi:hypothetical protein